MPTAKARYIGDGEPWKPKQFSKGLRQRILEHFPDPNATICAEFGHPSDQFVEAILSAAGNAAADLRRGPDLSKQEIRAECKDILRTVNALRAQLQQASFPVRQLLPLDLDLLEHAEKLAPLINALDAVGPAIDSLSTNPRPAEVQHSIAVDMAIRVLTVIKDYGIPTSATFGEYKKIKDITAGSYDGKDVSQYISVAVDILKAIGDDIGLVRSEATWKDIICEAKAIAPDVQ